MVFFSKNRRYSIKKASAIIISAFAICAEDSMAQTLGPSVWQGQPAGVYRLKVLGTNLCAGQIRGGWIGQVPHLVLQPCDGNAAGNLMGIVPTEYANGIVKYRIKNFNKCATIARNVVFGPPAIDFLACDGSNAGMPFLNAAPDQRFTFELNSGFVRIITKNNKCIGVQNGQLIENAQLIEEDCNSANSQKFVTIADDEALHIEDHQAMGAFGWARTEFLSTTYPSPFYRKMDNLNIPSADYNWFATDNDNGIKCRDACFRDNNCKAYTWVNPIVRNGQAMCYLKNAQNVPTADNFTMSGFVRH